MEISDILRHLKAGNNPPLYEIILHFWIKIFGIGEVVVRSLSLIFSALTAAFLYKTGNEFFSKSTGIVAGLLFTFSNYATLFAHEARGYALFGMLTCLSFYLFLRWINDRYTSKTLILFTLVNIVLLYTHYFGIMIFIIQVFLSVALEYRNINKLKRLAISLIVTQLFFAPYIPIVLEQFGKTTEQGTWLKAPQGWATIEYMLAQFANSSKVVYAVLAIFLLATVRVVRNVRSISKSSIVVLAWFLIPFLGMFFLSYAVPMFHNRYLMHTFIGFILLTSIASRYVINFPIPNWAIPMLLVIVFMLTSDMNVDNGRHSREAVAKVQELRKNGARVVMFPKYRIFGYAYYFNKDRFKNFDAEYGYYNVLEGFKEENFYGINQYSEARVDSTVNQVIFMMTDAGPIDKLLSDFEHDFELKDKHHFDEIIDVYEFERR